jgi:hypothetical protein
MRVIYLRSWRIALLPEQDRRRDLGLITSFPPAAGSKHIFNDVKETMMKVIFEQGLARKTAHVGQSGKPLHADTTRRQDWPCPAGSTSKSDLTIKLEMARVMQSEVW